MPNVIISPPGLEPQRIDHAHGDRTPMKNQMEIMPTRCIVYLPENDLNATNTNAITPAQKMGRWYSGRWPSEGSSVQPYTRPFNSDSGLGLVTRLTTTVTDHADDPRPQRAEHVLRHVLGVGERAT
jgi:hypothetical protein